MAILDNKKIIIIGDRDGIPAPAIEKCLEGKPADVIFAATECFV
jgi:betaine reductase